MRIQSLPPDEAAVRRFVERLWLPYNRELERIVEPFALAELPDADIVDAETEFRLGRLREDDFDCWVAVETDGSAEVDLADTDADLAGFVTAERVAAPSVFDRPDRVVIGDIYVREAYRGGDLSRRLIRRIADHAETVDAAEVALDVDTDNDRARAFYDELGFEHRRSRLVVDAADL